MQSTFSGIELGKRSLFAHSRALSTVGHNLSNQSTEGYSRQRVLFQATDPLYRPQLNRAETPGQIGQGVDVASVERVRDQLLEQRIIASADGEGYWEARDSYLLQLDQIYNEPSDLSVRNLMNEFWSSWQELGYYPEQGATRQAVIKKAEALVEGIGQRYKSLTQLRQMVNDDIRITVEQVNDISREIAELNEEIVKVQAAGDNPNDLLDRRDLLVENLSKIVDITIDNRDPDEFTVHTGGIHIVQGKLHREFDLQTDPNNDGMGSLIWDNGEAAEIRGGKLFALFELRDEDLRGEVQALDNMTINFTSLVNEIHRDAYGINGQSGNNFFIQLDQVVNAQGNIDTTGDGAFDQTRIFQVRGTNSLVANQQIGLAGTMSFSGPDGIVEVSYNPTDTVNDLIRRINVSGAEVVARLDRNDRLTLKAAPSTDMDNPDFVLRTINDTGEFLAGYSGILLEAGGAGYDFNQANAVAALRAGTDFEIAPHPHPAGWLALNQEIVNDPGSIATSFGTQGRPGEYGDGRAAQEIAAIRNTNIMVGRISSFDDYFADTVASVGLRGQEAEIALRTQELIMKDLRDLRDSISGVNIDEELAEMIKFQHGYNAAARFVSNYDQMLDTIINRMGV
jgi:flagellar hook-associated protein 1 FlgK